MSNSIGNVGKMAVLIAASLAGLAILVFGFVWTCCRVYVPHGHMAIVTAKTGEELPPDSILAEPGQKGVQRVPLAEGRHFLNPITHDWRLVPVTTIPAGSVGVVTAKSGRELADGEIIAADRASKGVWKEVLGPGTYRLNPEGYAVKLFNAINIPIGYVGVVTSLTGRPAAKGQFAQVGEKGVIERALQPGLYYINPRAYQVDVVEIGMNQVSIIGKSGTVVLTKAQNQSVGGLDELQQLTLRKQVQKRAEYVTQNANLGIVDDSAARNFSQMLGLGGSSSLGRAPERKSKIHLAREDADDVRAVNASGAPSAHSAGAPSLPTGDSVAFGMNQFVQFPSSDGFSIMLDMTVEFELLPGSISRIFMLYGDLPAVVSKILMPQILSISRLKGSDYKARDFIDGEGRLKFQKEMTDELVKVMKEKHIVVRNAIVRHVEVPEEILKPIQSAAIAKEQDLTNQTQQQTEKRRAELNAEVARIEQFRREVEQETEKLVATIKAETQKEVSLINAATKLKVAQIELDTAKIQAEIVEVQGKASAQAKFMVENEEALGLKRRAAAFRDSSLWADLTFVDLLSTNLCIRVIHSGEGTLWTDLKGAGLALPAK
ncbi:MAG: SPFH domain-containing protein [Kiritimatiellia bacterium]